MVWNKKLIGLLVLATFSTKAKTRDFKKVAVDSEGVALSRLAKHKKLIYDDTDLIIRDKNKKVIFQVLSSGKVEVKDSDGKKSLFTATPNNSTVEVNRGKMKVGATQLTVSSGNVTAGGNMTADNLTVSGDVSAGGSVKTDSMLPLTPLVLSPKGVKRGIEAGEIKITDGVFKFGPEGAECTMDASTGKIDLPAGMFFGKDSVRIERQFKFNNPLYENKKLTVMTIPVPSAAAEKPFSCIVDLTYLADAASSIDEYGVPTYVGTGYSHIRFFVTVYAGTLAFAPNMSAITSAEMYDYKYLSLMLAPGDKIVKMLAPEYVPADEYLETSAQIVFAVSNTTSGAYGDPVNDIDDTAFTSMGTLVNQFVHASVIANIGVSQFDEGEEEVEHDDDEEPEDEDEDEEEE